MNRTIIQLPKNAVDREQAQTVLRGLHNVQILRLDYRDTLFAGHSFSEELANLARIINPSRVEIIGGTDAFRNRFILHFGQRVIRIPSR